MRIMNNSKAKNKVGAKIIVAGMLVILGSGSIADIFLRKTLIFISLGMLILIYGTKNFHGYKSLLKLIFLLLAILIFNYITSPYKEIGNYLTLLFNGVIAIVYVLITRTAKIEKMYLAIRYCLILLMLYGLINYFIYPFISNYLTVISDEYQTYFTYNYLFFYSSRFTESYQVFNIELLRNSGFFWEPGVNQMFLNLLLFIELQLVTKPNKLIVGLVLLSLVITYSSTGIVIAFIQLLLLIGNSDKFSLITKLFIGSFTAFVLSFLVTYAVSQKSQTNSYQVRALDFLQSVQMIRSSPWVGIGINMDYFTETRKRHKVLAGITTASQSIEKGNSNGLLTLPLAFGLPIGALAVLALYRQNIIPGNRLIPFVIFAGSLLTEPLAYKPLILALIFSSFVPIRRYN